MNEESLQDASNRSDGSKSKKRRVCKERKEFSPPSMDTLNASSKKISKKSSKNNKLHGEKKSKGSKNPWNPREDAQVLKLVDEIGQKWSQIAKAIGNRTGKQVRDRYLNYLRSDIMTHPFTREEDSKLVVLQKQFGSKWCKIADFLPGRSECQVKNRYYNYIKKTFDEPSSVESESRQPDSKKDTDLGSDVMKDIDFSILLEDENQLHEKIKNSVSLKDYYTKPILNANEDVNHFISYCNEANTSQAVQLVSDHDLKQEFELSFEKVLSLDISQLQHTENIQENHTSLPYHDLHSDQARQRQEMLKQKIRMIKEAYREVLHELAVLAD